MAVLGSELPQKGVMRAVPVRVGAFARPCLRKVWFDLPHDTPFLGNLHVVDGEEASIP